MRRTEHHADAPTPYRASWGQHTPPSRYSGGSASGSHTTGIKHNKIYPTGHLDKPKRKEQQ